MTKGEKGTSQKASIEFSAEETLIRERFIAMNSQRELHEPFKENVQIYSRETFEMFQIPF